MQLKDEYFGELETKLKAYNLTTSLNKSRTTVGFTNDFMPVGLLNDSSTQINVYRTAEDCRGEPCDVKSVIEGVKTVILCQCFKADEVSKDLTDKFTDVMKETGEVLGTVGDSLKDTYTDVFNKSSYQNYRVWLNSVVILFVGLSVFVVIALFFESTLISSLSIGFVSKFSVEITVHQKLKELTKPSTNPKGNVKPVREIQNRSRSASESDSSGSTDETITNKERQKVIKRIKEAYKDDKSVQKAC